MQLLTHAGLPLGVALFALGAWWSQGTPATRTLAAAVPCPDGRIVIDGANTPGDADSVYRIVAPGSYYLTGNVVGEPGKHGIEVFTAEPVTIDLNGYALLGVPGSLDGINSIASTTVKNGASTGWGGTGVSVAQGHLESLHVASNGMHGIRALWGNLILDCTAEANGGEGISVGDVSRISGCVAKSNGAHGIQFDGACIVSDCVLYANTGGGILGGLATIRDNELFSNTGTSIEVSGFSVVTGNSISVGGTGIFTDGTQSRIAGNTVRACVLGIDVDGTSNLVTNNSLQGNTTGFDVVAGNSLGPIVSVGGVGDVSSTPGADHPLVNLEY